MTSTFPFIKCYCYYEVTNIEKNPVWIIFLCKGFCLSDWGQIRWARLQKAKRYWLRSISWLISVPISRQFICIPNRASRYIDIICTHECFAFFGYRKPKFGLFSYEIWTKFQIFGCTTKGNFGRRIQNKFHKKDCRDYYYYFPRIVASNAVVIFETDWRNGFPFFQVTLVELLI